MEGSSASQAKALFKATLLGLAILSMVTWVPHMYSCIKMFLVSVPSAASTLATPRCLFIFSNIIVIFLASELKLSEGESFGESPIPTNHGSDDSIRYRVEAFTLTTKSNDVIVNHVVEEQVSTVIVHDDSLQQLDQCEQVDASSTMSMDKESRRDNNNNNLAIGANVGNNGESEEVEEQGGAISLGKVIEEEMIEEEDVGLPTDELNRRVEDFIARFNMERQLEARMLVCCY
ncbi:uncharacterized protein [Oryza sativa Japonica Group]|uniref:Expressed protein n=3 Tax=Oryza TaxID=4527 RepID=Q2QRI7_ORYSJ|nr:uncharacterized protein LOC9269225 [Oryza sativa Japonica Group]ABA98401.1 expressed protein [Oryza sativa Japonica Group]KAF2907741.1 hypothetical protein DAI22_12g121900 [Oryza sativa Japonica Group]BAG90727.1 unnamed protein product [Oryza sativa Japonica Group]BAH95666.1 Os12g0460000 [Oryza sativa Japonica Group]BAT17051.1 Os12g0460100 [Oryza sativa Japonica Group]|eukprot:NP_001176938.1 Os12g0460000 [Oryza sativa Japonica Group]